MYVKPLNPPRSHSLCFPHNPLSINVGFFDDAYHLGVCGGGAISFLPRNGSYHIWLNIGSESNTKADVSVVWALLYIETSLNIISCQIYGDSKCVMDWIMEKGNFKVLSLKH